MADGALSQGRINHSWGVAYQCMAGALFSYAYPGFSRDALFFSQKKRKKLTTFF